jgi:nitronate monooxygenase
MWPHSVKYFLTKLNIQLPLIQAPMTGGPTTPELVAAVSNAGGLGSIGGALMTPDNLQAAIHTTRQLTQKPFAVNLFTPLKPKLDREKINQSFALMSVYRQALRIDEGSKPEITPAPVFEDQLSVLIHEKIPIVSFTFGTPSREQIQALHDHHIIVIGTATNVREAIALEELGYDMIVAQGSEAGGHRGTFFGSFESSLIGTMALVPAIVDQVKLPVIAAGGIMDGRGLAAALCLGASAVQMGTAFLTCPESGIHPQHRQAILASTDESTTITSVFSGRPARSIRNRFSEEMAKYQDSLPDYPLQQSLTSPIRKKAAEDNRAEFMSLWAGQGTRLSRSIPATQLVQEIIEQALQIIGD